MTELLEKAIAKVKKLPDKEQDTIAAIILEKLENKTKIKDTQLSKNLAESIRQKFAQLEGVDELAAISRDALREPPQFD